MVQNTQKLKAFRVTEVQLCEPCKEFSMTRPNKSCQKKCGTLSPGSKSPDKTLHSICGTITPTHTTERLLREDWHNVFGSRLSSKRHGGNFHLLLVQTQRRELGANLLIAQIA